MKSVLPRGPEQTSSSPQGIKPTSRPTHSRLRRTLDLATQLKLDIGIHPGRVVVRQDCFDRVVSAMPRRIIPYRVPLALNPHFRNELFSTNLRVLSFISIYAGLNAVKTPRRYTPLGEKQNQPFQLSFNVSLKVDFQGSRVTCDGGLILVRELDERLGLEKLIEEHLSGSRQGLNKQFTLADLLRQSVYSRLAGCEDLNVPAVSGTTRNCNRA